MVEQNYDENNEKKGHLGVFILTSSSSSSSRRAKGDEAAAAAARVRYAIGGGGSGGLRRTLLECGLIDRRACAPWTMMGQRSERRQ